MSDNQSNNKRIAKNTFFMYIRMLVIMGISLFTSRVILHTLGEDDFGTYNIVGGVVILFTFISNAMATGTQRHLSYELGKTNGDIGNVFSACFNIHLALGVLVVFFAETLGLWFLNTKMNFPDGRMVTVNWIYQFSVATCFINIIKIPYNAVINAYERMSFFAYSSIIEASLKLIVVYMLLLIGGDKLLVYGILILVLSVVMYLWYYLFCQKAFLDIRVKKIRNNGIYRNLLSFSGWTLFGSCANMCYQQGVNIIINVFYGVAVNAAVGIANQVSIAVSSLVGGFQTALNPQLTKVEAGKDRNAQKMLIFTSSKFSFFIMYILAVPVLFNLKHFLYYWLSEYPDHTNEIAAFVVINALFDSISGPLWVSIFATGKVKHYQIAISLILLLNLPLSYLCGLTGSKVEYIFVIKVLVTIIAIFLRMIYLQRYTGLKITQFTEEVFAPVLFSCFVAILGYYLYNMYDIRISNFIQLLLISFFLSFFSVIVVWLIGLSKIEKNIIVHLIRRTLKK